MTDPREGIVIWVTPDRFIKQSDGHWYVYLETADFGSVDDEAVAYWNKASEADPALEVPVLVKCKEPSPVPPDETIRMVLPSEPLATIEGKRFFAAPGPRSGASFVYPNRDVAPPSMNLPPTSRRTVDGRTIREVGKRKHDALPVLSDELLFAKKSHLGAVPRKMQDAINAALRTSRAFVFDEAASYRVGEIASYMPDLIADQQEFARAPYPKTWIELDAHALIRAMTDAGLDIHSDPASPLDAKLGFLYTERGIYTASMRDDAEAGWSPFAYRPHQPMTHEQEQRFIHEFATSRMQIDQFFWGNAYDMLDPSRRRSLRNQHGFDILLEPNWHGGKPGGLNQLLQGGGAGDLKVALCAALMLIRPSLTQVVATREPGRKMVHHKPTTFIAHRVVTIKLAPDRLVRRIRVACKEERGRAKARWHEVRGHYCHNHRAKVAACIHDWEEVVPDRWTCRKGCGGKRAWRQYPEGRGSAEVGVVTKHYHVKP